MPKIHKAGVPLHPIVSFIQSPTYELLKHLAQLLAPLVGQSPSVVRNSKDFLHFITEQKLEPGEILVLFDVVSLFTNVPTELAINVACKRLLQDEMLEDRTLLAVDQIIFLLQLRLDAMYGSFRGSYYRQSFGTAMGSLVLVSIANLVMEEIEELALASFDSPPRFWKRYVDDTCTALPADSVSSLHYHLNSVNNHIQFTV